VAKTLVPVKTDRDPDTGEARYWFMLGQYMFAVRESLYEPAAAHGGVGKRVAVGSASPSTESEADSKPKSLYATRFQIAAGYLNNDAGQKSYEAPSYDLTGEMGVKLSQDTALIFGGGWHRSMDAPLNEEPGVVELGLGGAFYPDADSGFRMDATAGVGVFTDGHGDYDAASLFAAGLAQDFGQRGRKAYHWPGWTGLTLDLRGFYALAKTHSAVHAQVGVGAYFW
jgi:hypothetical protein